MCMGWTWNDAVIMLGWNHYFVNKTMRKLNIFWLNDFWQLGKPDEADEEDDEDLPLSKEHFLDAQAQPRTLSLLCSFTGCGVQKYCSFTHGGGSMSAFVAPICDCGGFVVLRTTTKKRCWKAILGLS